VPALPSLTTAQVRPCSQSSYFFGSGLPPNVQPAVAEVAALRHYDEVTLSDHLRIALSSRSVIDQAVGIVMAHRQCGPEAAFATLRTISQRRNIKLRTVAGELVDNIKGPVQEDSPPPERAPQPPLPRYPPGSLAFTAPRAQGRRSGYSSPGMAVTA
jgi:hypothetical protein